ncbi:hypothetical protein F4818DRAFT_443289 [Hypoxylon cercidicola]|nr:hypothetical protein F4818DRAFT_443289 [Hypoxylon cercidicola]
MHLQTELWTINGLVPPDDISQRTTKSPPLQQSATISRHFSIIGLPPSLTSHDFLGAIRHTGRVFSSSIKPSTNEPLTSTAAITFWDMASSKRFWDQHRDRGLRIIDHCGVVNKVINQADFVDSRRNRETPAKDKNTWVPSRVLVITGLGSDKVNAESELESPEDVVRDKTEKVTMEPPLRLSADEVIERFREACSLDLDQVIISNPSNGYTTLEVRFSSWFGQAQSCMRAYRKEWKRHGINITYGVDPCV